MLAQGRAYPGCLTFDAPPVMPEKWCHDWYALKVAYRQPWAADDSTRKSREIWRDCEQKRIRKEARKNFSHRTQQKGTGKEFLFTFRKLSRWCVIVQFALRCAGNGARRVRTPIPQLCLVHAGIIGVAAEREAAAA